MKYLIGANWRNIKVLITNILLGFIIFLLIIIFGGITSIDRKLSIANSEKKKKFYKSLMDSIKKEGGTKIEKQNRLV